MSIFIQIVLLALGFAMLAKGADWFVEGTAGIAEKFGIPQLVIGLTIVAMGTSAPEAAVSITAALGGNADITIGNIVGSNILNILVILGISGTITCVAVQKSTLLCEIPFMLVITCVLLLFGITGGEIVLWEGIALWVLFISYLTYLFIMAKKGKNLAEHQDKDQKKKPVWLLLILAVIGGVIIVWGSDITVKAATKLAEWIGLSERFIGLTVVALGTSLPELFTSVTASMKGKADIAIGNIVGSNIFNILFVVGTSALITPVVFQSNFVIDTIIAVLAGIILWLCTFHRKSLRRGGGIFLLIAYAGYFTYLLVG